MSELSSSLATASPSPDQISAIVITDEDKRDFDCKMKLYETYRDYAVHEDDLVNHRMTWLLTIHGFLYATYGFMLQKKLEIAQKLIGGQSDANGNFVLQIKAVVRALSEYIRYNAHRIDMLPSVLGQVDLFLMLITCVGSIISGYALNSIYAATKAVKQIRSLAEQAFPLDDTQNQRKLIIRGKRLPDIAGAGNASTLARGASAALTIPLFLLTGWGLSALFLIFPGLIDLARLHIWSVPALITSLFVALNVSSVVYIITAIFKKIAPFAKQRTGAR